MYHSITFGDKNTWDDWHLIPKTRPVINPPEPKTNLIDIPGGNGMLDLSPMPGGRPVYSNRTGTIDFYVNDDRKSWHEIYSEIMAYLQGQKMRMVLEDDPDHYYEGRYRVSAWKSEANWSVITIEYNVGPFKKEIAASLGEWLWDTFNFETGVIRIYKDIRVSGATTVRIVGLAMPTSVIITASSPMTVQHMGREYAVPAGQHTVYDITLWPGENEMIFTGSGTVTIEYEGGVL